MPHETSATATLYEVRNGAAWITLNRPERRNALSAGLVNELFDDLIRANGEDAARCVVITGSGSAFCAGADLKDPPGGAMAGVTSKGYPELLKAILDSPKPVIAAINGAAFAGGLGLVGAADIVVAAEDAQFSFSEVRIGVIPAIISVVCTPKLGIHNAMRLYITGERFSAQNALTFGLVHHAVPTDVLQEAVQDVINMIHLGGPNAVQECKKLVRSLPTLSIDESFAIAETWSREMFRSAESTEGMAAFREKRKPAWAGSH